MRWISAPHGWSLDRTADWVDRTAERLDRTAGVADRASAERLTAGGVARPPADWLDRLAGSLDRTADWLDRRLGRSTARLGRSTAPRLPFPPITNPTTPDLTQLMAKSATFTGNRLGGGFKPSKAPSAATHACSLAPQVTARPMPLPGLCNGLRDIMQNNAARSWKNLALWHRQFWYPAPSGGATRVSRRRPRPASRPGSGRW